MIRKLIYNTLIIITLHSCATVSRPTGGPKDKEPPKLIYSNPKNQQLNFKNKEIVLEFNEWITFEKIKEQLIITPRTDIEYTTKIRKTKAYIEFDERLPDSTTFTLNFREGIVDLTEKNPWKNSVIAFSTTSYIDTAFIQGKVWDYKKNEPANDAVVSLYLVNDTSNVFDHQPYYFTRTNNNGEFILRNIKQNNYYIYAFEDKNKNLRLDTNKEKYGYYNESLNLRDSIVGISIHHHNYDINEPKIKNASTKGKYFEVTYGKAIEEYKVDNSTSFILPTAQFNDKRAIRFFKPDNFNRDSVLTYIHVTDTIGMNHTDTLYVQFKESKVKSEEFKMNNTYTNNAKILDQIDFTINFNKPVRSYNSDSVFVFIDSGLTINFTEEDIFWNEHKTQVQYKKKIDKKYLEKEKQRIVEERRKRNEEEREKQKLAETQQSDDDQAVKDEPKGKKEDERPMTVSPGTQKQNTSSPNLTLKLFIKKAAYVSHEFDSSSSSTVSITFKKSEENGIIKGNILGEHDHFIIQLLNKDFKIIDEIKNERAYTFRYVAPDTYKIRVLVDLNKNGKWDPGHIDSLSLPEPIVFLQEELTVRANWELIDKDIDLSPKEEKQGTEQQQNIEIKNESEKN